MARIKGAKNFHLAGVTANDETYTAETPKKCERLIAIEIETKAESEDAYSDDEVEETVYGTVERTGKVTLNYLTPETKLLMFGGEIDKDGVYFPPGEVEVKHNALGFQMPTTGGKNKYAWYYDVVFEYPNEKAETAEGKPKLQQVEIPFKCYKNRELDTHVAELDMNGKTANAAKEKTWFKQVPTTKAQSPTEES
ncbi:MAG: major tail protein [Clostridium paraputrificum]